jgi:uncharacterized protein YegL
VSVLVTVVGRRGTADLELDDGRPVHEIQAEVAEALGEAPPVALSTTTGRHLHAEVTLAAAGVVDGQTLSLVPAPVPPAAGRRSRRRADVTLGPDAPSVLPCYLVVDTSHSMKGPPLDAVNVELVRLWEAIRRDARLAAACRLAILSFDGLAQVEVPLTAGEALRRPPRLAPTRPATNHEAAFRLLRRVVRRDVASLRGAGLRTLRPLVVLVTDGRPTRGYWPPAYAELVDPASPHAADVLTFGFGDVCESVLRRIGTAGAFLPAATGAAPEDMLGTLVGCVLSRLGGSPARSDLDPGRLPAVRTPTDGPPGWRSLAQAEREERHAGARGR